MKYKKIMSSMLLCGAAIGGLVSGGHVDSYLPNTDDGAVVISARDRYEEIKIILTSKINKSELLNEADKLNLIDQVKDIKLEDDVLEVVKLIEKSEIISQIKSLKLSDSDIKHFIEEIENLEDASDVLSKAKDKESEGDGLNEEESEDDSLNKEEVSETTEEIQEATSAEGMVDSSDAEASSNPVNISPVEEVDEPQLIVEEVPEFTDKNIVEEAEETEENAVESLDNNHEINEELPVEETVEEWISEESEDTIEEIQEETTEKNLVETEPVSEEIEEIVDGTQNNDESYELEVVATAYSRNQPELNNTTATGIDLTQQTNVIAVDPNVIPLGSTVEIPGYGTFVAGDTGSAIIGNRIDIHMEDLSTAQAFGNQSLTIKILNSDAPVIAPDIKEEATVEEPAEEVIEEDSVETTVEVPEEATVESHEETTEEFVEDTVEEISEEVVTEYEEEVVVEEIEVDDYIEEVEEVVESSGRYDVGSIASQYVGVPYVWGGSDPSGFDCSGLTSYSFAQVGIQLPRTSQSQSTMGQYVDLANVQPGDLIFWGGVGSAYHVGIYVGDGSYIHAPDVGSTVQYGSLEYSGASFARRL